MTRWLVLALALGALTACPEQKAPDPAPVVPTAAIPTEADFAEDVEAEINAENFEAKLTEIEAAIEADKSR